MYSRCARLAKVINAMESGKRIVLSTFGSFGDIHPYMAIALELKARGHSPVIATSEVYREKMDALGLEFYPIRPDVPSYDQEEELAKLVAGLMEPRGGTEKVMALFLKDLPEVYADLNAVAENADLLLTHAGGADGSAEARPALGVERPRSYLAFVCL
ncbi:MAG: glycosyltransferase [Pyrinomonadaceae bacterium]